MIYRVDVSASPAHNTIDPAGAAVRRQLAEAGLETASVRAARIYLIDTDAPIEQIRSVAQHLLADPIAEQAQVYDAAPAPGPGSVVEIHLKPGVMDPLAASTEMALRDLGVAVKQVRTGRAYQLSTKIPLQQLEGFAKRYLANVVVETTHFEPVLPAEFASARIAPFEVRRVPIRQLTDEQLTRLSRDGHLFLNLAEMQAIQQHYRALEREPTDAELETLAQTWSEHCVHKTLKSAVEVMDEGGEVLRTYRNLIKETIFASTQSLIADFRSQAGTDFCLSVFKDNAGVIAFDETDAVCFKVETHNRPSAIEPYGGAATGIGGCIRDVLGTGLGAKPIANTNVFCVAFPDHLQAEGTTAIEDGSQRRSTSSEQLPRGVIHPKRILQQVVAGVRDYGNRMGIPTVNGAVYFDDRYVGNPLVFAGCVGLIPRTKVNKQVSAGEAIVLMGGRTGRDGIHGATFSSAELTGTHADEFSHAVQIGNAITQKKMMDVLLEARDRGLYSAITDCGAGGLSSAVGEMGGEVGAEVELERVPLKYQGLRYDEIWISEAQERMVLSVPTRHIDDLLKLASDEDVEATVIGLFGTPERELVLRYHGTEVARMDMHFVHEGIPMPTRRAVVRGKTIPSPPENITTTSSERTMLLAQLAHPNVASKHWIIRQYDHEVQGQTIVKPLVGPQQTGPSDAAVLRPKANSLKGVIVACGLAPAIEDPYEMALAAIDEALRNAVCVGADLATLAILDNFCWPGVHDEIAMGSLVRACEACRDGALGYRIPFISGKDSLHNQFVDSQTGRVIRIPNTLLISAIGVINDVRKVVTMDLKRAGSALVRVRPATTSPTIVQCRAVHETVSRLIHCGKVRSAHDVSDGGWLVAVAEMAIASGLGVQLSLAGEEFAEHLAQYVLEVSDIPALGEGIAVDVLGTVTGAATVQLASGESLSINELTRAWRGTLDW